MQCRLLVAEDEKYLREKVTQNVDWESHDFIVYEAADGKEALSIIEREPIDILVTDIRMPRLDGIELTRRAKELRDSIRVIVISGYAEFELAQASIRLGVDDYILKPFRSQRLLEVVSASRQKLKMDRLGPGVQGLQNDITQRFLGNQENEVFRWLSSPEFFIKQFRASSCWKLKQILTTGTVNELNKHIKMLNDQLEEDFNDKGKLFILINTLVVDSLEAIKEMGFDLEHGAMLMKKHLPKRDNASLEDLKAWVRNFLTDIDYLIKSRQTEGIERLVREIQMYIDCNYRRGVSLTELAEHVNVSSSYLSKLFLEHVGEHFSDYVNNLKSQKAKELLKTTDQKIYEIADYLGFNDAYYFSAWFKRTVGCSPTEYRTSTTMAEVGSA